MASIVLSTPFRKGEETAAWLLRNKELAGRWMPDCRPCPIEWMAQREGIGGPFPDDPEVDRVEQCIQLLEEKQLSPQVLLLPVSLSIASENYGEAISTINGWTDLASYAGMDLIRLTIVNTNEWNWDALREILDYMEDLEFRCSIVEPSKQVMDFLADSSYKIIDIESDGSEISEKESQTIRLATSIRTTISIHASADEFRAQVLPLSTQIPDENFLLVSVMD